MYIPIPIFDTLKKNTYSLDRHVIIVVQAVASNIILRHANMQPQSEDAASVNAYDIILGRAPTNQKYLRPQGQAVTVESETSEGNGGLDWGKVSFLSLMRYLDAL